MWSASVRNHVNASRHAAQQFEMGVQSPLDHAAADRCFSKRSFRDSRQSGEQRTVDECDSVIDVLQAFIQCQRLKLLPEFTNDLALTDFFRILLRPHQMPCRTLLAMSPFCFSEPLYAALFFARSLAHVFVPTILPLQQLDLAIPGSYSTANASVMPNVIGLTSPARQIDLFNCCLLWQRVSSVLRVKCCCSSRLFALEPTLNIQLPIGYNPARLRCVPSTGARVSVFNSQLQASSLS